MYELGPVQTRSVVGWGGAPVRREATGYGCAYFVEEMLGTRGLSFEGRRVVVSGTGNVAVNAVWKLAVVAIYAALYELTPLRLDPGDWWVWVLLFFLVYLL